MLIKRSSEIAKKLIYLYRCRRCISPKLNSLNKKEKILDCAEVLFAKEGFKGCSIRQIAKEAQCNQAMIHYYFGNKEKLYVEIFRSRWMQKELMVVEAFTDALSKLNNPRPSQVIEAYVRAYIGRSLSASENQTQRLLIVREISNPGEAFKFVNEQINKPTVEIFLHHLKPYVIDGVDENKLMLSILAIFGMVYYFTYSEPMVSSITSYKYSKKFKEELIQSITEFALKGFPLKL